MVTKWPTTTAIGRATKARPISGKRNQECAALRFVFTPILYTVTVGRSVGTAGFCGWTNALIRHSPSSVVTSANVLIG